MHEHPRTAQQQVKVAAHRDGQRPPSPHLLDLKETRTEERAAPGIAVPRGPLARLMRALDERIHLRDLRARTVSIRQRGWKDFPPASASTMRQAVWMTVVRFFDGHPLADLTMLAVVHITAVIIWKIALHPIESLLDALAPRAERAAVALPGLLPMPPAAAIPPAAVMKQARNAAHEPRRSALFTAFLRTEDWQRKTLGFAAAALLFVLPLSAYGTIGGLRTEKEHAIDKSMRAVALLHAAGNAAKNNDFGAAGDAFDAAAKDFVGARAELGALGAFLNSAADVLPVNTPLTSAGPLLAAGEAIAVGGAKISAGLAALDATKDPMMKLRLVRSTLQDSLPQLLTASRAIGKVADDAVPERFRPQIAAAKRDLPKLAETVTNASAVAETLESILGKDGPKRYLVVFQNNSELRPTGGFIGSFALIDVNDGKVKTMDIPGGGSYDLKGQLALQLNSPQPLHLVNARWQFQDANWYPDFPTSAATLTRFYSKSGGPTVDGVIAVTATFMEKLLSVTGPIDMPEYGKTITSQNFFFETQKAVELDYDKARNKPKKFIADLAPRVIQRVIDADRKTFIRLATTLDDALGRKELLFWFKDQPLQRQIAALGWDGAVKQADGDYLYLVHTNIAGQKTDLAMKDDISHAAKVLPDGGVIVTLTLSRAHTGQKGALFSGVRNVDYLRAYVPKGSVLVSASGFSQPDPKLFKIPENGLGDDPALASEEKGMRIDRDSGTMAYEEGGKTVFANWVQTDPGRTSVVTLVYQLPPGTATVTVDDGRFAALYDRVTNSAGRRLKYSLLVQKQPGANPARFVSSVDLPRGYFPVWQSPERVEDGRGSLSAIGTLERDSLFGIVAESQ